MLQDEDCQREGARAKQAYAPPKLIRYGAVTDLTQGGSTGTNNEFKFPPWGLNFCNVKTWKSGQFGC